jgi:hypothetical protein
LLLFLGGCGQPAAVGPEVPELTEGPLPPGDTEIGRVVTNPTVARARYCADIGLIDMGAVVDGPAYYFRRSDGVIIGRCGGFCMGEEIPGRCARECPPPGWQCHPAAGFHNP